MLELRSAIPEDLNLLVWIDIKDEGVSSTYMAHWSDAEWAEHRERIRGFIQTDDKVALIAVDPETQLRVGALYADYVPKDQALSFWPYLAESLGTFAEHSRFGSVFQLWVDPEWRRQGIALKLKQAFEDDARNKGVAALYTKTETENSHVIELNLRLGYTEIYRGPMWDHIERVALLKTLQS